MSHNSQCGWHCDQYPWECDCGELRDQTPMNREAMIQQAILDVYNARERLRYLRQTPLRVAKKE